MTMNRKPTLSAGSLACVPLGLAIRWFRLLLLVGAGWVTGLEWGREVWAAGRWPSDPVARRAWLENMVGWHGYSNEEVASATGLTRSEVEEALRRWPVEPLKARQANSGRGLVVLPYPGGRHPRIGFLEGAVDPQRETKLSLFLPWPDSGYAVVDVPEAIWCQHGLLYLAHSHIPTLWTLRGGGLEPLEWQNPSPGRFVIERTLPNNVRFGSEVHAGADGVRMRLWIWNGGAETLRDLRIQNCVMLKGAPEFNDQTNANKRVIGPFVACKARSSDRWLITAWQPLHRAWNNPPVPCLHSDPRFADCPPGGRSEVDGWIGVYEGSDLEGEVRRLTARLWP